METTTPKKPLWLKILRWTARIIAIIFIVFILVMFIGEGGTWSQPRSRPLDFRDYALLFVFGMYVVGLIIGLWKEGLGGIISFVFMAGLIIYMLSEGHNNLTYFYVMLLPSILF